MDTITRTVADLPIGPRGWARTAAIETIVGVWDHLCTDDAVDYLDAVERTTWASHTGPAHVDVAPYGPTHRVSAHGSWHTEFATYVDACGCLHWIETARVDMGQGDSGFDLCWHHLDPDERAGMVYGPEDDKRARGLNWDGTPLASWDDDSIPF